MELTAFFIYLHPVTLSDEFILSFSYEFQNGAAPAGLNPVIPFISGIEHYVLGPFAIPGIAVESI